MRAETRLINAYLNGYLPLPGFAVQGLLYGYLEAYYGLESVLGRRDHGDAVVTDEIAARSRELMATHYNMPLAMFTGSLGPSMKYSMGLWERGARTLEEAQTAMLDDLCEKAGLRDGQRILDIGCGFGSLAAHLLRRFPRTRVYGLTLSETQADYMRACQGEPGHPLSTDRFYLIQADFNEARFDQPFDRAVSVGVFEHVSNLSKALERVRSFLTEDGACFLHFIVYRPRPGGVDWPRCDRFIERYIFPGGRIWADTELAKHAENLRIEHAWFFNGTNYKRTLQAWLGNFRTHYASIQRETGLSARQLRIWEFYLRACIAVFSSARGRRFGNGQYLMRPV